MNVEAEIRELKVELKCLRDAIAVETEKTRLRIQTEISVGGLIIAIIVGLAMFWKK